jgi:hypothetical protein
MRFSSGLDIFTGLIFLAFFAAMPTILTWQAQNTLAPYGALNKVDFVVQNDVLWGFMLAFVLHKDHLYGATWWQANIDDAV